MADSEVKPDLIFDSVKQVMKYMKFMNKKEGSMGLRFYILVRQAQEKVQKLHKENDSEVRGESED